jgi:hypothetical protein
MSWNEIAENRRSLDCALRAPLEMTNLWLLRAVADGFSSTSFRASFDVLKRGLWPL